MYTLLAGNSCNLPENIGKVLKHLSTEKGAALPAPFGEHQLLRLRLILVSPYITLSICFSNWYQCLDELAGQLRSQDQQMMPVKTIQVQS